MNSFLPLLHRPIFEKSLADDLHLRDDGFGGVVLLVASVGSRFSDNMRVLPPGTNTMHSAGWVWFDQVEVVRRSLFSPPSLYDLQIYCVCGHSTTFPHSHDPSDSYLRSSCKILPHGHAGL